VRPPFVIAHLATTGLGPIYDGISHVLISPDDLVPIIAIALLAGLNGPAAARSALFALTGAWLAGGIVGVLRAAPVLPAEITTLSFLLLGTLTAFDRRLSPRFVAALAMAIGLLHGWLNGVSLADVQREGIGLAGIASAAFVIVALTSALVVALRAHWARIAVRVAGSWVAAIGVLMLGWSLRGPM
jgi:hydrogenase/urease accessory protein HupE